MLTLARAVVLGVLVALMMAPGMPAPAQDRDYDDGIFHEELAPYGSWSDHPRWGAVWRPNVDGDWRPYSRGRWAYTQEHGWYWLSDEPFGWAVFHYGRWVLDEDEGWLWIPGSEWGPAWVAWRESDDYVGWAPLPPQTSWGPDGALLYDESIYHEPRYASAAWCFARPDHLMAPGLYGFLAPRRQALFFLGRTSQVRGFYRRDRGIFNGGYDVRRYERRLGQPVPLMRLRSVYSPREHGLGRNRSGADIPVFRPRIIERRDGSRHRPPVSTGPDRRRPDPPSPGPGIPRRGPGDYSQPGPPGPRFQPPPTAGIPPGEGSPRSRSRDAPPPQKGPDSPPPSQRRATPPPSSSPGGPPPYARQAPPPQPPPTTRQGPPPATQGPPPARSAPKKEEKKGYNDPK